MRWSNKSVGKFALGKDPVATMEERARDAVLQALDKGWKGPPFDPIHLADLLKIAVSPSADIKDARTLPLGKGKLKIEFNPNRPPARIRFSIAHEIAHTFFPDCMETIRYRREKEEQEGDNWQVEMLCNIGAAELIMPLGSFSGALRGDLTIEDVLDLRKQFEVSAEALIIRIAKVVSYDWAAFCASRIQKGSQKDRYKVDYVIPSPNWTGAVKGGELLPPTSIVSECTAIGYTEKGVERWGDADTSLRVECVGLPSYPGASYPRVAGLLKRVSRTRKPRPQIKYVIGDALSPRGHGNHVIAQVVNDGTPNWGGAGFASAVRRKWNHVQNEFRDWVAGDRRRLSIGSSVLVPAEPSVSVFCMVAQRGYGPSPTPRIRYVGLERCLRELADEVCERGGNVHMPRIGTGHAGGQWPIIEELISQELVSRGVPVTVYEPPGKNAPSTPANNFLAVFPGVDD
jgi:hypothetical protein